MTGDEEPTRAPTPPPDATSKLERLLAQCLEARMAGDEAQEEELLRAEPALAPRVRTQLADLARTGLLQTEPHTIGPYRVLELLGRGGMGEVYLAEQREPVQRKVALKLVKRGMDTREILARFAAERQALARMSHPAIARVYDAGSTADGRPWFAMEHVAGLPITAYCDRRALDTASRLELFLAVCEGVQHAHLKGFLHRDLKPSNLLVAEIDGRPAPKVIDFGIAKAIDDGASGGTLHTAHGAILGTPEYMSPEQASRDGLDLDLRTDIYSLGVVLYELLTGELPFASERLRTDVARLQQILREEDPLSPSRRVTSAGADTAERAKRRRTTVHELVRRLRGDLDWICLKALAKDREERYASVSELAADIRRHLANEPVLAGPPSGLYRLRKYVRRHRLQVASALAVLLALIAGLVVSSIYRARAETAARDAAEERELARAEAANAREARDAERRARLEEQSAREEAERGFARALAAVQLLTQTADEELEGAPRLEAVRKRLLETARSFCRELLLQRGEDPRAQQAAALAHTVLASIAHTLGESDEALRELERAHELWERLLAAPPADHFELRLQRARTLDLWGQVLSQLGRDEESAAKLGAALVEHRAALELRPDDPRALRHLAVALAQLAHQTAGREPERSTQLFAEAREALARAARAGAEPLWVERLRAVLEVNAVAPLFALSRAAEAEAALERARAALGSFALEETWDVDLLEAAAELERKSSVLAFQGGRRAEAIEAARAFVERVQRLRELHPETPAYRVQLAEGYGNLAVMLVDERDPTPSLDAFRSAAQECEGLLREHPENAELARSFSTYAGNHAHALLLTGRREHLAEARRYARAALERGEPLWRARQESPLALDRRVNLHLHLAEIEHADGDAAAALPLAEQALALLGERSALVARHPQLLALELAAALLVARAAIESAELARARAPLDLALERLSSREVELRGLEEHAQLRRSAAELEARWYLAQGDSAGAEAATRRFRASCEEEPSRCRAVELELLVAVGARAEGALRSSVLAAAELAARDALAALDQELEQAPAAEEAARRERRARARIATARLRLLGGERGPALALLDPALEELLRAQREGHVDRPAQELLSFALELAAEEARRTSDEPRFLRSARALLELADPLAVARGTALLLQSDARSEALELLERRAQRRPALRAEDFHAAELEPLRADARFRALFELSR